MGTRRRFVRKLPLFLLLSILVTAVYATRLMYANHFTASVRISLVYPEIGAGRYPDGSRFSMYDFLDDARIEEALGSMREKGWYTNIQAEQIQKGLKIAPYLVSPVHRAVESIRASGYDYGYYCSEYTLSYTQPYQIRPFDLGSGFGFMDACRSGDFLRELVKANVSYLTQSKAENSGVFLQIAQLNEQAADDYEDQSAYYASKVNACLDYLREIAGGDAGHVSPSTGESTSDLIASYQALLSTDIEQLNSFIKASYLTNQPGQYLRLREYLTDTSHLEQLKKEDEVSIAKEALSALGQGFTSGAGNPATVSQANGSDGADATFAAIARQALDAASEATESKQRIARYEQEANEYKRLSQDGLEYARLCSISEKMLSSVKTKYIALTDLAVRTLKDNFLNKNQGYLKVVEAKPVDLSKRDMVKFLAVFTACMALLFIAMVMSKPRHKNRKKTRHNQISDGRTSWVRPGRRTRWAR